MGVRKSTELSYYSCRQDKVYQQIKKVKLTFKYFMVLTLLKCFINMNGIKRKYVINLMKLKNS